MKNWLGINKVEIEVNKLNRLYTDLTSIGIDVHFKEPHMILIYSHLNGGQIRHIDADFDNISDLNSFVRELKDRFKVTHTIYDRPFGSGSDLYEY